jgi:hypothetical protein
LLLQELLDEHAAADKEKRPVFCSSRGQPLTRFGIYLKSSDDIPEAWSRNVRTPTPCVSPHTPSDIPRSFIS